jgi:succinoglycan biosynthesis protein ExoM
MNTEPNHICVCVCTYKRPDYLKRLLDELQGQETNGFFTFSVVVADNDPAQSAEAVVSQYVASSKIQVHYCVQPEQSVSLTRNKALENASGNFIAFIDDDEFPDGRWLLALFEACSKYGVDGALGPVLPNFDERTPKWVVKGKFYERPTYPTGFIIDWHKGRTGNVLFKRAILPNDEQPFRPQFRGGGADQDFFRRMIEEGHRFVWCNEAIAHEIVPPVRWKRSFMLRRALLRGGVTPLHPTFSRWDVVKSLIAVPAYTIAMPFALVIGHHRFMSLMIRLCDHLGKLLACIGIRPIKAAYITE